MQATPQECEDCRNRGAAQTALADRAASIKDMDRAREVTSCTHRGRVLQGYLDGCCETGKTVATLVECKLRKLAVVYECFSCSTFQKALDNHQP